MWSARSVLSREHYRTRRFLTSVRIPLPMPFLYFTRISLLGLMVFWASTSVLAVPAFPPEEAGKHLPVVLGEFKATSAVIPLEEVSEDKIRAFGAISAATRSYKSKKGDTVFVTVVLTRSDSSAYSLLTDWGCTGGIGSQDVTLSDLAGRSCVVPIGVHFAK